MPMSVKTFFFVVFVAMMMGSSSTAYTKSLKGFIQTSYVDIDNDAPWLDSWLENGTGVTRYDSNNEGLRFNQALLEGQLDIGDHWSFDGSLLAYSDGQKSLGVTEAAFNYQPITEKLKHTLRVGAFYPNMSLENVDIGWHSPYTYSFSAINSWFGEELRIIGAEYKVSYLGRRHNSPHSIEIVGSLYGSNDGFGSLLSWRGWAIHDRQTLLGERVNFANYPSFEEGVLSQQPSSVEPFKETDDRPGYYVGAHWRFKNSSDLRIYYYDNLADPEKIEPSGQYAWDTQFSSVAWQYRFNKNTRLLTQWVKGATEMGPNVVAIDFESYYLLLSHAWNKNRLSFRYDWFDTTETDKYKFDPNNSQGFSYTLAWRHQLKPFIEVGMEYLFVDSDNENRKLFGRPESSEQQQIQWVFRAKF